MLGRATALLVCAAVAARAEESDFKGDDGWFDVSNFVQKAYGFVPVIAPITEPAVGYGAAGALVFISRDKNAPAGTRPDLYLGGGMYTESQSWGGFGGYSGNLLDGDLRVLAAGGYLSLNLKHYGVGSDPALSQNPISYNLRGAAGRASAAMRIGSTPLYGGLGLSYANTQVTIQSTESMTTMYSLRPYLQLDTRDNIFTPVRGVFSEASLAVSYLNTGTWFELLDLTAIGYLPLVQDLYLGVFGGAGFSFGDAPFYMRPFVILRGAPSLRYQGEQTAEVEAELRWQFWKRFSLVAFSGVGGAWDNFLGFDRSESVFTYGTGFRYELARKFGLHMGADFAFGKDGFVLYIQFGSAWGRL